MIRLAVMCSAIALLPAIASAQPCKCVANISGSIVTLRHSDEPNAAAEVEFYNRESNSTHDTGPFTLSLGGMQVDGVFTWNAEGSRSDRITVTPPAGFIAIPDTLDLAEESTGTILIYPDSAVGM